MLGRICEEGGRKTTKERAWRWEGGCSPVVAWDMSILSFPSLLGVS